MMCFAHLMPEEHIRTILEHRRSEVDRYLDMFEQFEKNDLEDWTPGMQFVCGFGKAVITAIGDYLDEHGDDLLATKEQTDRAAAG